MITPPDLRTVNNCKKKRQKKNICRELKQRTRRRRRRRQRERQKSIFNWFRLTKQQLYTCITFLCSFLCRRCTPTTCNFLFSRIVEDVNRRQQFSFYFPELRYNPLEFNPRKNRYYLSNWTRWNKLDKVWSSVNILFERRFCSCRRRCCFKSFLKCGAVHWQTDQCYSTVLIYHKRSWYLRGYVGLFAIF